MIIETLIKAYRLLLSPVFGPGVCRYYPTCSVYARDALRSHGILRGGRLALARLLSCHPYSSRPFLDPVPSSINTPELATQTTEGEPEKKPASETTPVI